MRKLTAVVAIVATFFFMVALASPASAEDHTVQPGDSLSELVDDDWNYVCIANIVSGNISSGDCDIIHPGERIRREVSPELRASFDAWFSSLPPPAPEPEPVYEAPSEPAPAPAPEPTSAPAPTTQASGGYTIPYDIVMCESGGDYSAENPSSSASGAYQITDGTWGGYGGYSHASDAPPAVQDERAAQIWNGGAGRNNWVC